MLDRVTAVHCDLGRSEWAGTKELAERQCAAYGLPLVVTSRNGNDLLDQVQYERKAWPAIGLAQYCTSDHKTAVAAKVVTQLTKDVRTAEGYAPLSPQRKVRVLQVLGIRAQESSRRGAREPMSCRTDNRLKQEDEWFPIFDYTTEQVWDRIKASGVEHHSAYDKGMSRLSCCFCVVAKLADLRIAGQENKGLLAEYVQVERAIGHSFKQGWAIEQLWAELYGEEDVDAAAAQAVAQREQGAQAPQAEAATAEPQAAPQADATDEAVAEAVAAALYTGAKVRARRCTSKGVRLQGTALAAACEALGGSLAALPAGDLHHNASSVVVGGQALRQLAAALGL